MKHGRVALLVVFCILLTALPALAQNAPLVAFVNSGGQLVVSSGDGGFRWVVTNPGETLIGDPAWAASGDALFFAVSTNSAISLRSASISQQAVSELGTAASGVLSLAPNGSFDFGQSANGSYFLESRAGDLFALPVTNDASARYSGLWSDALPLVAYWGYNGSSSLAVTNASNGETALVDSGRSSPVLPLAWLPGTSQLIYRDADGQLRLADFSCLQSACSGSPDDFSIITLATGDADVATDGDWLFFRSGGSIAALDLTCAASDICPQSAVLLAPNAAPQTAISVANERLVYTGYAQNASDPNDREVRVVNLACLTSGGCAAQTVLAGAAAGALSPDGRYLLVESANGLESLDLSSGARAYLSDRGAALNRARWQS